jgi:hypothetical protein
MRKYFNDITCSSIYKEFILQQQPAFTKAFLTKILEHLNNYSTIQLFLVLCNMEKMSGMIRLYFLVKHIRQRRYLICSAFYTIVQYVENERDDTIVFSCKAYTPKALSHLFRVLCYRGICNDFFLLHVPYLNSLLRFWVLNTWTLEQLFNCSSVLFHLP